MPELCSCLRPRRQASACKGTRTTQKIFWQAFWRLTHVHSRLPAHAVSWYKTEKSSAPRLIRAAAPGPPTTTSCVDEALVLLLLAAATADDDVSGSSRLGGTAAIGGGTTFLYEACTKCAAATAIDRWFQFHTNNESYAPKAWTVTKPDDVPRPWHEIGASSKSKTVYRATVKGKSVIVKGRKMRKDGWTGDARHDQGGGVLYLEMVYLEAPRRPASRTAGAFWDGPHVVIVVADGGGAIGEGPPRRHGPQRGGGLRRARAKPAAGAGEVRPGRWLFGLDFFQDDLKAQQFTMDAHGTVHGRRPGRAGPALGRAIHEPARRFTTLEG